MLSCPICLCKNLSELGVNPDFQYSRLLFCRCCGFMWTHPAPSEAFLSQLYSTEYPERVKEQLTQEELRAADSRATSQRSFILKYSGVRLHHAKILDIGCSVGSLLISFIDFTEDLIGFEPDINAVAIARSRLPARAQLHAETFNPKQLKESVFHLITASHVLEHVPHPIWFLSELFRLVRGDGVLFLEVPHETKKAVTEILNAKLRGKMHLSFFDPDTLKAALIKSGWTVVYMSTFGPDRKSFSLVHPRQGWWTRRIAWYSSQIIRLVNRHLGIAESVDAGINWHNALTRETPREGIWIRVIAKKPLVEAEHKNARC